MYRSAKIRFGQKVATKSANYSSVMICSCDAISANKMTSLRLAVRKAGGIVQMGGNLIIGRALEDSAKFNNLGSHLKGSNFMVFFDHNSPGGIVKAVDTARKENKDEENNDKISIKYCAINGQICDPALLGMLSRFETSLHATAALLYMAVMPFQALAILSKQYYELLSKEGQES